MKKTFLLFSSIFLTFCTSCSSSGLECLNDYYLNDSLKMDNINFYAGYGNNEPALFQITDNNCKTLETAATSVNGGEGYVFDTFIVDKDRITVQYFLRSEGVNSAIAFLLSKDKGESWETIWLDDIDSSAEGIWELILSGESEITLKLFDLVKPNKYKSSDNGRTWNVIE